MSESVPFAGLPRSPRSLDYAGWLAFGKKLSNADHFLQFKIGDWLNWGSERYERGKYEEGLKLFRQYEKRTLRSFSYVAEQIESGNRLPHLPWTHHQLVAPFEAAEQSELLERASADTLSLSALRRVIRDRYRTDPAPLPRKKKRSPLAVRCTDVFDPPIQPSGSDNWTPAQIVTSITTSLDIILMLVPHVDVHKIEGGERAALGRRLDKARKQANLTLSKLIKQLASA